jgi:protein involved in polysaccharide export with SLBB domain
MKIFSLVALVLSALLSFAVNADEEEVVQVGDLIQVSLPGESSLNRGFQVDKKGRINLPEVGPLFVAGYDEKQLKKVVLESLESVFRDLTNASVYISERQILVSIQGYVESPGEYTLPLTCVALLMKVAWFTIVAMTLKHWRGLIMRWSKSTSKILSKKLS